MVVGAIAGTLIGAIVAVNIVIYAGPENGYEATIGEVFADNPVVGLVTLAVLISGPVLGILTARRLRQDPRARKAINTDDR